MENSPGFLEEILKVGEILFFLFIDILLPKKMLTVFFTAEWKEVMVIGLHQSRGAFSKFVFLDNINPGP